MQGTGRKLERGASGDQDWRGATQGRHQHRCRTQQHGISSWTLIH